jgi:hypothetical protein
VYAQDRKQIREVFFRAWQRHLNRQPLEGIELMVAAVALRHPEYHALLASAEANEDRDFLAQAGETNPFLHMGMHIAIEEQLSIDQPGGIRAYYQTLLKQGPDEHTAQHRMMDCMGEMLWQAGRNQSAPDPGLYLDCLARLCGKPAASG